MGLSVVAATASSCNLKLIAHFNLPEKSSLKGISTHEFSFLEAKNVEESFQLIKETGSKLIVLQYPLPGMNFTSYMLAMREFSACGCIVLLKGADELDRTLCLEAGADDCCDVDIDPRELLARIRAVLRRMASGSLLNRLSPPPVTRREHDSAPGMLAFDRIRRCLRRVDGTVIPLTTAEFNLISVLSDNQQTALSRDKLYQLVYGRQWSAYDRTLDTLIAKLRKKVETDSNNPELIMTVHGTGYVFTGHNFCEYYP